MRLRNWVLLAALAVGCDDGGSAGEDVDQGPGQGGEGGEGGMGGGVGGMGGMGGAPACVPDADGFAAVAETVQTYCGDCHGETPQFGAPQTLNTFDGMRDHLERSLVRMRQGTMPPAGQPQIPASDLAALFDWATCGEEDITPNPGGFDVSRDVFPDPGNRPEGSVQFDLLATDGGIAPDLLDNYRCWSFSGTETDRFIQRMEPIIDDARVLHHMVLYQGSTGPGDGSEVGCGNAVNNIIYAWAPGQQALSFPEGGLRTGPGIRYVLEIHYNNSAALADVVDESGVRFFHGPAEGKEVGMISLGPEGFSLPNGEQTIVDGQCNLDQTYEVIAAMPHMHEVGWGLKSTLYRAGSDEPEDFITLTDWDFNAQYFYTIPVELQAGDRIITECTFRNMTGRDVRYGPRTQDEMCYNFVYVSPPPPQGGQCNLPVGTDPNSGYTPGECAAPEAAQVDPPLVIGGFAEGEPPAAVGGEVDADRFVLSGVDVWVDDFNLGFATLDPAQSEMRLRGTLFSAGALALDVTGLVNLRSSDGQGLDAPVDISLGGSITGLQNALASITGTCGQMGDYTLPYSWVDGRLSVDIPVDQLNGTIRLHFSAL